MLLICALPWLAHFDPTAHCDWCPPHRDVSPVSSLWELHVPTECISTLCLTILLSLLYLILFESALYCGWPASFVATTTSSLWEM